MVKGSTGRKKGEVGLIIKGESLALTVSTQPKKGTDGPQGGEKAYSFAEDNGSVSLS